MSCLSGLKSKILSAIKLVSLSIPCLLFSGGLIAQSNIPSIDGNILRMPVVAVLNQTFRIDFQIVSTGTVDLVLTDFAEVSGVDTTGAPAYISGLLNLPNLPVDGVSYWGEFALVNENPITFRLQVADVNKPGPSGVEGKWQISEVVNAAACGEGQYTETYSLRVAQSGNQLTVNSSVGVFTGTLTGTTLQWSGNYNDEDGGSVSTSIAINFSQGLNSFSGSSNWNYTLGALTCSGSSQISGQLLHN